MECLVGHDAVRCASGWIRGAVMTERHQWSRAKDCVFFKSRKGGHLKQFGNIGGCARASVNPVISCTALQTAVDVPPSEERETTPGRSQFLEAAQRGNVVPVYRRIFSDHLTPVLAYRCLIKEDDRDAPSFLFESVENGKSINMGRYSIVGVQPSLEIIAKEDRIIILNHEKGTREEKQSDDPLNEPQEIASKWNPVKIDSIPDIFCVRYVEKKKLAFSSAPKDDRGLPDIHLGLYNDVLVFDHVTKLLYVLHWVHVDQFDSLESAFEDGCKKLDHLVARLQAPEGVELPSASVEMSVEKYGQSATKSNFTPEQFKDSILQVKEHILAGDIFQLVLSQRFERRTFAYPFEVYRALRIVNPSPYMIYLQARGAIMVASSPEILTRISKGTVVNRPLAGTRKRGKTPEEDMAMERDLLGDEKECAEHVMLVDLGRNDVGKVSKAGTVKVEKFMEIERYSHVMHISSTVTGELLDELSSWDALRAALPVGTVSGAPKVRAMELIDELEPTRRGPYSGGIGGVSFTGQMDIALALRTMVFPTQRNDAMYSYKDANSRREWVVHLQAGAGIVADSDAESEYLETINKAAGLARAIDLAEAAFCKTIT
ncbi:anthranilate synthase alpha subunit 1, chloroplastic isoform X2 [Physcomitrium patens]|uniref:anthranilate synthase alpha subunit 1, chloroplastic isoform X2 n=1 Tax=Physcomitrium patens TaxID=3218 RepID=UPI003CCDE575